MLKKVHLQLFDQDDRHGVILTGSLDSCFREFPPTFDGVFILCQPIGIEFGMDPLRRSLVSMTQTHDRPFFAFFGYHLPVELSRRFSLQEFDRLVSRKDPDDRHPDRKPSVMNAQRRNRGADPPQPQPEDDDPTDQRQKSKGS